MTYAHGVLMVFCGMIYLAYHCRRNALAFSACYQERLPFSSSGDSEGHTKGSWSLMANLLLKGYQVIRTLLGFLNCQEAELQFPC